MNITVNKTAISYLLSDKTFVNEIESFLNSVIDEEIEKADEMDTQLIDECIEILSRLDEDSDNAVIIPFVSSERIMALCHKKGYKMFSKGLRTALIACIVLASVFTANAAIAAVFDYDILLETVNTISEKLQDIGVISTKKNDADIDNTQPFFDIISDDTSVTDNQPENETDNITQVEKNVSKKSVSDNMLTENKTENNNSSESVSSVKPLPVIDSAEKPIQFKKYGPYTLYLDPADGVCDVKSISVEYGQNIPALPKPDEREGYAFLGWYCPELLNYSPSGSGVWIKPNWVYGAKSDLTATAIWDKLYNITIDPNGGECDVQLFTVGANYKKNKLPTPVLDGYKFEGWYYGDNCADSYGYSSIYKESDIDNITLVAHWSKIIDYSLFFDANGGQCDIESKIVRTDEPYGELPVPVREGYTFLGWYDDKEYQYNEITSDDVFGSKKNKTVYAIWGSDKNRIKINFDAVDGECDVEYKYGYYERIYGELPLPTKYGYEFTGWTNQKGNRVYSTDLLYSRSDVTLYANYRIISNVKLTFYTNYSGGRYYRQVAQYMSNIGTLPYLNVTRIGYAFDGWYTEREGGRKVEPTDIVDFVEDTTYYAHWIKLDDCKITIHKNDGSEKIYTGTIANGDTFDISEVEIPENDKIFIGWYDMEKGGNKIQGKIKVTQDIDIYAHWKSDGYCAITAHIGDKARRIEVSEVKYGEPLGDLYYNVNGVHFLGWYTEEYFGERIDESTIITQDIEIYAHWSTSRKLYIREAYKPSYKLNEAVTPYDFKLAGYFGFSNRFTYIDEETMKMVRCTADTSDYGTRTVYLTYVHDCDEGVLTYFGETTIFVEGCPHDSTAHIEGAYDPSCTNPTGYTGDTVCDRCGAAIEMGKPVDSLIHTEGYHSELINSSKPTCAEKGYTGDIICTDCGKIIVKGSDIPALGHDENSKTITYDEEPGCISYGFKGRVECIECGNIIDEGETLEPIGHNENTPVEIIRKADVTCFSDGYTGDAACRACGQIVSYGKTIPATGHDFEQMTEKAKFGSGGIIKEVCKVCHRIGDIEEIPKAKLKISTTKFYYDGTVQTPEISVTNVPDDCYTLEIEKGSEIGCYKITATLFGDYYEGTKVDYYRILPPNTEIDSLTARSKGITVKPSNICDAVDGYQIEYRVDQIMPVVVTTNYANNGRTEFVKTGLESKTRYSVRIRAYKDVIEDDKKVRYYSDWSNYKYVRTLK